MNKKRIFLYVLAVSIVVASSSLVYASTKSVEGTKNLVTSIDDKSEESKSEASNREISDEEAINIATEAMKNYMGKDASFFSETSINRFNNSRTIEVTVDGEKYMVKEKDAKWIELLLNEKDIEGAKNAAKYASEAKPNIISVSFLPKTFNDRFTANCVDINADTREILSVSAMNQLEKFNSQPDKNKIKDSTINFFNKIDKKIDENSIFIKNDIDYDFGRMFVELNLSDGDKVSIVIDLKDYSVIQYRFEY
ncbi:hypothetical protein ACQPU1_08290 [Clostridium paraputrificum]|uniref:hypothetical protein n=1 Tax=Clostridium paraputrificum TaxID=29363 RepID=UPI003D3344CB